MIIFNYDLWAKKKVSCVHGPVFWKGKYNVSIDINSTLKDNHSILAKLQMNAGNSFSVDSSLARGFDVAVQLSEPIDIARYSVLQAIRWCGTWRRTAIYTILHLADAYNVNNETAAHAMSLLDRFLAANLVESDRFLAIWNKADCFATSCFLLATKFKDVRSPCASDLVRVVRLQWSEEQIELCEGQILCSIDWALHATTGDSSLCKPVSQQAPVSRQDWLLVYMCSEACDDLGNCRMFLDQNAVVISDGWHLKEIN